MREWWVDWVFYKEIKVYGKEVRGQEIGNEGIESFQWFLRVEKYLILL